MKRNICRIFFLVSVFGFVFIQSTTAAPKNIQDHERILEIRLQEGYLLHPSIIAYHVRPKWYVSIKDFLESIGIYVETHPNLKSVSGYILQKKRKYTLDVVQCIFVYNQKQTAYDCSDVIQIDKTLFIEYRLLEKWFPVKLVVDSLKSQLLVSALEPLPPTEKMKRGRQAKKSAGSYGVYTPEFQELSARHNWADGFFLDQYLMFNSNIKKADENKEKSEISFSDFIDYGMSHETGMSAELIGMETKASFSGDLKKIDQWNVTLSRKQHGGGLLGVLDANKVTLHHLTLPNIPLIGAAKRVRGLLVSNKPFHLSSTFSTKTFQGQIRNGWDVELYHDDILVGYQSPEKQKEYLFENVPLRYGHNAFKLVFHGPEGQRQTVEKKYEIDSSMIGPGPAHFEMAGGVDSQWNPLTAMRFQKYLFGNISSELGFSQAYLPTTTDGLEALFAHRYYLLGIRGFSNKFLYSAYGAVDEAGGEGLEFALKFPLGGVSLGSELAFLNNFRSPVYNQKEDHLMTRQFRSHFMLPLHAILPIGTHWEYRHKEYIDQASDQELINRLTSSFGAISMHHRLSITFKDTQEWLGKPSIRTRLFNNRFTFGGTYTPDLWQSLNFSVRRKLFANLDVGVSMTHQFDQGATAFDFSFNRHSPINRLGLTLSAESLNSLFLGLTLTQGLSRDPRSGQFRFHGNEQSDSGAASVFTYQDQNYNNIFDEGDMPVSDVKVTVLQTNQSLKTQKTGEAFFSGFEPHVPVDIEIHSASIKNIFLKPVRDGLRLWPRSGKVIQADFPLWISGEIDGFVYETEAGEIRPKLRVPIELIDAVGKPAGLMYTDSDGAFLFDRLKPGKYQLQLEKKFLKKHKLTTKPHMLEVIIPKSGEFIGNQNFILSSKAKVSSGL